MENKEKILKEQLEPKITEEELRSLAIKSVKEIRNHFGISYEDLKRLSKREIDILAQDAIGVEEVESKKGPELSEEQKREHKIMAKEMYEELLRDAEKSGNEKKIKIYQDALKSIKIKEEQE